MCLARGQNAMIIGYTWRGRVPARVSMRPLMPLRPVGGLMVEHGAMNQVVLLRGGSVEVQPIPALPSIAFKHDGVFMGSPDWWRRFEYLEDRRLGNAFQEDMWTPGVFEVTLEPNRRLEKSSLSELADELKRESVQPEIIRPTTLEDVFLKITGRELSGNA